MDDNCRQERDFLRIGIQEAYLCSEFISQFIEKGTERDNMISNLDKLVQGYCLVDNKLKVRPAIFAKLKNDEERRIEQRETAGTPAEEEAVVDFHQLYSDQVDKAMQKVQTNEHTKYKDFKKKVDKLIRKADGEEGEDDLAVTEETNNLVCPLSKATLVDPVITQRCKHRFSRKSIMSVMEGKNYVQCPYVACRDKFSVDELEEDLVSAQALRKMQLQEAL